MTKQNLDSKTSSTSKPVEGKDYLKQNYKPKNALKIPAGKSEEVSFDVIFDGEIVKKGKVEIPLNAHIYAPQFICSELLSNDFEKVNFSVGDKKYTFNSNLELKDISKNAGKKKD